MVFRTALPIDYQQKTGLLGASIKSIRGSAVNLFYLYNIAFHNHNVLTNTFFIIRFRFPVWLRNAPSKSYCSHVMVLEC